MHTSDITFDLTKGNDIIIHDRHTEPWKVTVVDTGLNTLTGGRLKRVQKYIGNEPFMMTYGDGVCDVNIADIVKFHKQHGKMATLTSVKMVQEKGVLDIGIDSSVRAFREKMRMTIPQLTQDTWFWSRKYWIILKGTIRPLRGMC